MQDLQYLAVAMSIAAFVMLTLISLRILFRAPNAPRWLANDGLAAAAAIAMTIAIAMSCAFGGYALSAFMPSSLAIGATMALHAGMFGLCNLLLIAKSPERPTDVGSAKMQNA
ncbi:MAG: hypothetical protein R3D67_10695 [Hyphomicrobiaceae bacterium]